MDGVVKEGWSSEEVGRLPVSQPESEEVHVLAVDDSLVDRKVIEHLLKVSACKVTAVDSGTRALQFLGLNGEEKSSVRFDLKVDLIITDYCMPEMTGFELLKKIKGSSTLREIPVVIMSSENVLTRIDRCLEEGAEDFIVKPVKLSDVKRLLNYYMREIKRAESEEAEEHTNRQVNLDGGGGGFCNKRKLRESYNFCSSTQSILSSTTSSSLSNSPSISPLSSSSPRDSPPSTPTPLDQQIQRVENDLIVNTN